jgi:hypothetical protein
MSWPVGSSFATVAPAEGISTEITIPEIRLAGGRRGSEQEMPRQRLNGAQPNS